MLKDKILNSKAIVVLGSGGVGKTTSSMGIAILAASLGKRVAVLSIDPSKRLATALGFEPTSELQKLSLSFISKDSGGEMSAAVVDQKKIFDDVVRKYGKSTKQVKAILDHPLYKAASSNLSGPIEYMSLAKFSDLYTSDDFDLVVLDTPPDNNALDFLARPNVLAGFIDKKIMKWLIKPFAIAGKFGMSKFLNIGEKLMGGLAKITGVSMLSQFANFLVMMQEVIEGFHSVGNEVLKILSDKSTSFFLVVSSAEDRMPGVKQFWGQLNEMGYAVSAVLANRCLSDDVQKELTQLASELDDSQSQHLNYYFGRQKLQQRILAELDLLSSEKDDSDIYRVSDMVGEIDNISAFSSYLRELKTL